MNGRITRLRLFEFRCHARLEFEPGPYRNALLGANGQGKTSILEAVYYLSRLRSFRTGLPRELARWPGKAFAIEAEFQNGATLERLAVRWEEGVRKTLLDENPLPVVEFWSRLPTVLFSAEDGVLIRGPAARRQGWLDTIRGIADRQHLSAVSRYNAILRQRNAWLRTGSRDRAVGEALTAQLLEQGRTVTSGRLEAAGAAVRLAEPLLARFFGAEAKKGCRFSYHPNLTEAPIDWDRITAMEQRQFRTYVGPHRDEWEIAWNGKSVARFGSEGEQRLAALLLRLIEAAQISACRGMQPIFLIDDALTPLDPQRALSLDGLLPEHAQILRAWTIAPACSTAGEQIWSVASGTLQRLS